MHPIHFQPRWKRAHPTSHRFKVKDHELCRDSLAAWACIKLNRLREGYRLLHLYDCAGIDCGGAILVRVTKKLDQVSA